MSRGDVDDAPPAVSPHGGQRAPRRVKRGRQIDGEDRLPFVDWELRDRRDVLNPGVVDHDIQPAEGLQDRTDHFLDGFCPRHIGRRIFDLYAELIGNMRLGPADLVGLAETIENNGGTGSRQRLGDAQPNSTGRAGYQRHFAIEGTRGHNAALRDWNIHGRNPPFCASPRSGPVTKTLPWKVDDLKCRLASESIG